MIIFKRNSKSISPRNGASSVEKKFLGKKIIVIKETWLVIAFY
jgi:hypothetical protein